MHHAPFLAFQRGMGEKAKMAETVVCRDHNHAARGQRFAVLRRQATGTNRKPASVQPDHNRKRLGALCGRPDVKVEAIFGKLPRIAAA